MIDSNTSSSLGDEIASLSKHFNVTDFELATAVLDSLEEFGASKSNEQAFSRVSKRIDLFKKASNPALVGV